MKSWYTDRHIDRQKERQPNGRTNERGRQAIRKRSFEVFFSGELCDKKYKKPFDEDKVNLPIHFMKHFHIHYHLQIIVSLRSLFLHLLSIWEYLRNIRITILLKMKLYTLNGPRSKTFKVLSSSSLEKL